MQHTAYINLGSNLGDRLSIIESAVAAIERSLGASARRSAPVETPAWGYTSANDYLNLGIAIATDLPPVELLDRLLQIQASLDPSPHRNAAGGYIDRRIDIDLIAVDSLTVRHPRMQLPHPRMHLRTFVLQPMAELAPHWRHPESNLTAAEMMDRLQSEL